MDDFFSATRYRSVSCAQYLLQTPEPVRSSRFAKRAKAPPSHAAPIRILLPRGRRRRILRLLLRCRVDSLSYEPSFQHFGFSDLLRMALIRQSEDILIDDYEICGLANFQ